MLSFLSTKRASEIFSHQTNMSITSKLYRFDNLYADSKIYVCLVNIIYTCRYDTRNQKLTSSQPIYCTTSKIEN